MPPTDPTDQDLRRRWRAWAEVVGAFAARRGGARRVGPAEYEAIHKALVGACEARARATGGPARNYYEGLIELVRPWLSAQALAQADGDLLWALAQQVRRIDRELNRGSWPFRIPVRYAVLAVAALVLVLAAAGGALGAAGEWLDGLASQARGAFRRLSLVQQLLAGGVVAAAVGGWLVSHTRRS